MRNMLQRRWIHEYGIQAEINNLRVAHNCVNIIYLFIISYILIHIMIIDKQAWPDNFCFKFASLEVQRTSDLHIRVDRICRITGHAETHTLRDDEYDWLI